MEKQSVRPGQRDATESPSGRKLRSPTRTAQTGSRAEPSHLTRQKRQTRAKEKNGGAR